jgi:poly(hydroxyalkanoate) depolymerase family esterase
MRNIQSTMTRLSAMRQRLEQWDDVSDDRLALFSGFGSNPGNLQAREYLPSGLRPGAPLVVVLHGCTQTPGGYNQSANWTSAADEHGFALLFPEQQRANNPNLCFNWFSPKDSSRGRGEALSIRQMVAAMHERHGTDSKRVFVTGLSAGGAMAAVMLAAYPEVFAGGAVIAGLPFGTARSVPQAFDRMRAHGGAGPDALAERVRSASTHKGPWPILSVWHGTSDVTVDPSNARALVDQWRVVHGIVRDPSRTDTVNGYPHRVWKDAGGREVIEEYVITGMGHGTPLSAGDGFGEVPGPFMLDVGISSTRAIARFWKLDKNPTAKDEASQLFGRTGIPKLVQRTEPEQTSRPTGGPVGIQKKIEDALRAAGLMR